MDPDEIMFNTEEGMEKAVSHLTHEFASVRTGKLRILVSEVNGRSEAPAIF